MEEKEEEEDGEGGGGGPDAPHHVPSMSLVLFLAYTRTNSHGPQ